MKKLLLVIAALMILGGCSTKFSTIDPESGARTAYIAQKKDLVDDTELMMMRIFPGRELTRIDRGRAFGFSTWTRFVLDTYTQQALFFAVKGKNAAGEEVDAWALEVSGEGSSGSGRKKNIKFWEELKAFLDKKYPVARVN